MSAETANPSEREEALARAISESNVTLLAAGPGEGAVTASKRALGAESREIEVSHIAGQSFNPAGSPDGGLEAIERTFKEAARRSESVVVSSFAGLSAPIIEAVALGVKNLAASGGRAVVVASQDVSAYDFGPAIFLPWTQKPGALNISAALRERFKHIESSGAATQEASAPKRPAP